MTPTTKKSWSFTYGIPPKNGWKKCQKLSGILRGIKAWLPRGHLHLSTRPPHHYQCVYQQLDLRRWFHHLDFGVVKCQKLGPFFWSNKKWWQELFRCNTKKNGVWCIFLFRLEALNPSQFGESRTSGESCSKSSHCELLHGVLLGNTLKRLIFRFVCCDVKFCSKEKVSLREFESFSNTKQARHKYGLFFHSICIQPMLVCGWA